MLSNRIESHQISKQHPIWKVIDENCFYSKNVYNSTMYAIRQEFINNGRWMRYRELVKTLKNSNAYIELKSQPAQQTIAMVDAVWKAFFTSVKDWKAHSDKYLGRPKLPKYLPKRENIQGLEGISLHILRKMVNRHINKTLHTLTEHIKNVLS